MYRRLGLPLSLQKDPWRHLATFVGCRLPIFVSFIYFKWSYDLRSYERNFYNCVEKPEKFRTSTGFEPVTSRFRCDALTNWAMKPLTLGACHLWVLMVPSGMNQWQAPNVSSFIAQLVRASHRNREVTGSNPVEVLNFSGFSTQL